MHSVVVVSGLRGRNGIVDGAIIGSGVALSKVVGLNMSSVATQEFPIDFIKIIRFENDAANNTLASCCLHDDGNDTEEDVKIGLDGWRVTATVDNEFAALIGPLDLSSCSIPDLRIGHCSIPLEGSVRAQGRIDGAIGGVERIA